MNLFYCPGINPETIQFVLPEDESSHCVRVLRMKTGHVVFITDGKGMFYQGEITNPHPKKCKVKIISIRPPSHTRPFRLTIAIAPTKNTDRFEWFLEKATEIGCDEIIPIACKHSERTVIKTERLNKILISAMKQCLKPQLPELHELTDFKKFIESAKSFSGQKLIGHIPELDDSEFPPKDPQGKLLSKALLRTPGSVLIAIGPEGGFSEEEVSFALQNNFTLMSLGNSRLRVETAGVVACSIVNTICM